MAPVNVAYLIRLVVVSVVAEEPIYFVLFLSLREALSLSKYFENL